MVTKNAVFMRSVAFRKRLVIVCRREGKADDESIYCTQYAKNRAALSSGRFDEPAPDPETDAAGGERAAGAGRTAGKTGGTDGLQFTGRVSGEV